PDRAWVKPSGTWQEVPEAARESASCENVQNALEGARMLTFVKYDLGTQSMKIARGHIDERPIKAIRITANKIIGTQGPQAIRARGGQQIVVILSVAVASIAGSLVIIYSVGMQRSNGKCQDAVMS